MIFKKQTSGKKFPIYNDWKKEKLKLTQYIQIYKKQWSVITKFRVNKYVLSDLLKLEMVLDFQIS